MRLSKALSPDIVLWFGSYLVGTLYGGIHLIAWDGPFPTKAEGLL
jgi:hypothetical protein